MCHVDLVQPRCLQSQLQGVGDILGFHRGAELPGNDVPREVVKNRRQVEPTPTGHLQVEANVSFALTPGGAEAARYSNVLMTGVQAQHTSSKYVAARHKRQGR